MPTNLKWKMILILAVIAVTTFYIIPTLTEDIPQFWKNNLPHDKIHLGLDLQGGMHLLLEVEREKAVENTMERKKGDLKKMLIKKGVRFIHLDRISSRKFEITLIAHEELEKLRNILDESFPGLKDNITQEGERRLTVELEISAQEADRIKAYAFDQALETIRNRVDQFGISEPDIAPQGKDRIIIQLPGIKDPARAIKLIGKTALLEFKLLDEEGSIEKALGGDVPPEDEILYQKKTDPETGRTTKVPFLVKKETLLTGDLLNSAQVRISSQFAESYVSLEFDTRGAKVFEFITEDNVGKRLAIVLDGNVYSAPVIQEKITGGSAQITGNFTTEEAHDLAIVLRAGSLPAPVTILENRTVGPSLGRDSINQGIASITIGGVLVVIFILLYYKRSGLIANLALALNILLIVGVLAAFKAVLTLPGIAGIVLTIGMAIDANVLIFERIREEIRLGKTPRAAVEGGYAKSFYTIMDANITTLIAAVVLFQFGTGPVKGFAVTLSIGIISSLFTAMVVTRVIFDYILLKKRVKALSI